MIEVESLTKRYGRATAVDGVSFRVERGEILGFLGPNGAGKTTTMRILTCYLPPTEGTARVAGYDVFAWNDRALLRAYRWLNDQAGFPAEGEDRWQMHLVNHFYGTTFSAAVPTTPGKNMAFTDWTHPPGSKPVGAPAEPPMAPFLFP